MSPEIKFRFKTEQEFIEEFGPEFSYKVKHCWARPAMDKLFGRTIDKVFLQEALEVSFGIELYFKYGSWRISIDMIKLEVLK